MTDISWLSARPIAHRGLHDAKAGRIENTLSAFDAAALSLRASPSLQVVGAGLRDRLAGSGIIAAGAGRKTQDALSLRAVPHVHGAARDAFAAAEFLMDYLKTNAPFWKSEERAGNRHWVDATAYEP